MIHLPIRLLVLSLLIAPALAQTVTVTTPEDVVDVPAGATLASLPGPDGRVSFREALLVTNNMPGPQTVAFAIPQADWWFFSDYASLKLEDGIFFITDDGTTLDFTTQTAFTGDTNPNGQEVGIYGLQPNGWGLPAIGIFASDCVVRGLGPVLQRGTSVWVGEGSNNRIVGCTTLGVELDPYPGTTSFNVIGGTAPGDGNVLEEVDIFCGANDNVVIGNHIESLSVVGSQYCELQYPERNRIGGPTPAERNVFSGAGSYSSEGYPTGENVEVLWARDTLVQGNYIGVTPDGLTRVPQVAPVGVSVADSFDTVVRDNLIAGMYVVGINHYAGDLFGVCVYVGAINADTLGVTVQNNLIGTDVTGAQGLLTLNGVRVAPGTALRSIDDVLIGGGAGQGNVVAFTERTGVEVTGGNVTVSASILGNSIHSNGLLGIDLGGLFGGADGVTPNDALDADGGANGGQNFPELATVTRVGADLRVTGALHSTANDAFRVELFGAASCDPSGFGEGELLLGDVAVTTDAAGNAAFDAVVPGPLPDGWFVTATATRDASGDTSEFSACAATVWADEGNALAGAAGAPLALGQGDLTPGSPNAVLLSGAAPNALAGLFVGLAGNPTPFFGGLLLPVPTLISPLVHTTTLTGGATQPFTMPTNLPTGAELWLQWAVLDGGAVQGVALSNALKGIAP